MKAWVWVLLSVGGLGAVGALYIANGVHESNVRYAAERAEEAAVTVEAYFVESGCPDGSNLVVEIKNGSHQTLKDMHYELAVYESGRSDDISALKSRQWTDIVGPGEKSAMCYPAPLTTRKTTHPLEVKATKSRQSFYLPGEFIPRHAASDDGPAPATSSTPAASHARPASRGAQR